MNLLNEVFWVHDDFHFHTVEVEPGDLSKTAKYLEGHQGGTCKLQDSERIIYWRHYANILEIVERSFTATFDTVALRLTFGEAFVIPCVKIFTVDEYLFILVATTKAMYRMRVQTAIDSGHDMSIIGKIRDLIDLQPTVHYHAFHQNASVVSCILKSGEAAFAYLLNGYINLFRFSDPFRPSIHESSIILLGNFKLVIMNMKVSSDEFKKNLNIIAFNLFELKNSLHMATLDERKNVCIWCLSRYSCKYKFSITEQSTSFTDVLFLDIDSKSCDSIVLLIGVITNELLIISCELTTDSLCRYVNHSLKVFNSPPDLSVSDYRAHDKFQPKKYLFFFESSEELKQNIFFLDISNGRELLPVKTNQFLEYADTGCNDKEEFYLNVLFNSRLFSRTALNKAISVFQRDMVSGKYDYENLKGLAKCLCSSARDGSKFWKRLYHNVIKFQRNEWAALACFQSNPDLIFVVRKSSLSAFCEDKCMWKYVLPTSNECDADEFLWLIQRVADEVANLDSTNCLKTDDFKFENLSSLTVKEIRSSLKKKSNQKVFSTIIEMFLKTPFIYEDSSFSYNLFSACVMSRFSLYVLKRRIQFGTALIVLKNYLKEKSTSIKRSILNLLEFYNCCLNILSSSPSIPSVEELKMHSDFVKNILPSSDNVSLMCKSNQMICDGYISYRATESVFSILSDALASHLVNFLFLTLQFEHLNVLLTNDMWNTKNASLGNMFKGLISIYQREQANAVVFLEEFLSQSKKNVRDSIGQFLCDDFDLNKDILSVFLSRLINSLYLFDSDKVLMFLLEKAAVLIVKDDLKMINWTRCFSYALNKENFDLCHAILKLASSAIVQYQCFTNLARVLYENSKYEELERLYDVGMNMSVPMNLLSIWKVSLRNIEKFDLNRCNFIARLYARRKDYRNAAKVLIEYALKTGKSEDFEEMSLELQYELFLRADEAISNLDVSQQWILINNTLGIKNTPCNFGDEDREMFCVWTKDDLHNRTLLILCAMKLSKYMKLPPNCYDNVNYIFNELCRFRFYDSAILISDAFKLSLTPMFIDICTRYCDSSVSDTLSTDDESLLAQNQSLVDIENDTCAVLKAYLLRYPETKYFKSCLLIFLDYGIMPPSWFIQEFVVIDAACLIRIYIKNGLYTEAVEASHLAIFDILTKCSSGNIEEYNVYCAPIALFDQLRQCLKIKLSKKPECKSLLHQLNSIVDKYIAEMHKVSENRSLQFNLVSNG